MGPCRVHVGLNNYPPQKDFSENEPALGGDRGTARGAAKKRKTGRTGWGIFVRTGGGSAKTAMVPPRWNQVRAGMNTSNSVDINGNKIRLLREQKELTQLYLATVVGVTTDTISRWENRRYPSIKPENARKLAEALGVPLEELLDDGPPEAEAAAAETVEAAKATDGPGPATAEAPVRPGLLSGRRRVLAAGLLVLLAVAAAIFFFIGSRAAVRAERVLPPHTAPGAPFPVVIRLTGEVDAPTTVLVRDELTGDAEATGPAIDGEAKAFGRNPRWIGHLRRGRAVFPYLVQPGKKLGPDDEIRFSGDIIAGEGQTTGDSIDGASRIRLAPYHWADTDKDYVISDSEIRKAYATYSVPGESLVDFSQLEELWVAGRYTWNRKTRTFAAGTP